MVVRRPPSKPVGSRAKSELAWASAEVFIFDVEGTLIDCAAQMIDCWEHTFTKAGHQISRSELQRYSGKDGEEMLRSLLPASSTTMRQVLLEEHGRSYRRDFLDKAKGFEGAHEVVARLHEKGHTIAIATTGWSSSSTQESSATGTSASCKASGWRRTATMPMPPWVIPVPTPTAWGAASWRNG